MPAPVPMQRVGLLPSVDHEDAPHLHRAALVITRADTELPRYGRAALGKLKDPVGTHRLPGVGACVVWGSDDLQVARALGGFHAATMLVVLASKLKKDSKVATLLRRLQATERHVEVVVFTGKDALAYDLGPDRTCRECRPSDPPAPEPGHAPSAPRAPLPAPPSTLAPSVRQPEPAPAPAPKPRRKARAKPKPKPASG